MNTENLTTTLICFSPTATTRRILEQISAGLGTIRQRTLDITLEKLRKQAPPEIKDGIVLLGAPVYSGRLPRDAADYFKQLKSDGVPVVPVVVYGNREFEDALIELKDIAEGCGFSTVAAAAFIGEHSFSTEDLQIAHHRPDDQDMAAAFNFGKQIASTMEMLSHLGDFPEVTVPGKRPYKEAGASKPVPFIDVAENCSACGLCAAICPKEAIDEENGYAVIDEKCIHCCACIKACPESARKMKDGPVKDIARWLNEKCAERKEPELFFAFQ